MRFRCTGLILLAACGGNPAPPPPSAQTVAVSPVASASTESPMPNAMPLTPPGPGEDTAIDALRVISRDEIMAWEGERMGPDGGVVRDLCASTRPVPTLLDPAGAPHASTSTDWSSAGWDCLRFDLTDPTPFQYETKVFGTKVAIFARRAGPNAVELILRGEVDPKTQFLVFAKDVERHPLR